MVPALGTARNYHQASLLPSGKVLVIGGYAGSGQYLGGTESFDPTSGLWSPAATMSISRANFSTVTLSPGVIMAIGGRNGSGSVAATEIYGDVIRRDGFDGAAP